ncbi:Serine-protein kinase ATM [Taenia solium]|eukprot:TsM_001110000 transcript=TsM_001110000 gene=TsM_001110000
MGNFKLASSILADNYTSRASRWVEETDMTISYLNSVFTTVESKADFILQFLTNKLDILSEGSVAGVLLENLIDLLMAAEEKHCQALSSRTQNCKTIPSTPQSPDKEATSVPTTRSCLLNESNEDLETDEGEEGEVLEEADEDDEEDMDDEDVDNQSSKLLVEKQCISVLNFHRMRLACEVLPMVYRTRNGTKVSSSQLHTLVIKSFQFLFTFAAQVPFAADGCPEIFGLSGPLPELLKMEPAKYLRLFLDMASDLLKWPVTGPSFQVQHHSDIFDMLRRCYHIYKDLEHEVQRQKGGSSGSGGSNSKKRTSTSAHNLSTVANQVACMFWSLFVEKGIAYLKEFSLRTYVPFCIAAVVLSIDGCDLPTNEPFSESLHLLQSLWSLRLRFKAQEKKVKSRSSRKAKSLLEDVYYSLQPQSGVSDIKFSCLLEFFVRVNLTLASLNDVNSDFEEVFENPALLSGAYSEEQFRELHCLLGVTRLRLKPPTQAKQLAADRLRLVYRVVELKLDDDMGDQPWTKLSSQTIVISVASARDTAEVCMASVEQWLAEAIKTRSSVRLSQVINALKTSPVRSYLDENSTDKWSGRQANNFTWKSVCNIILCLLQDELHVVTARRNNANPITAEFSECFRLLNIFLSYGLESSKLPLDEVFVFLFDLINDASLVFLQPFAVDSLSSLLWHLPIETQALEVCNLSRKSVFGCFLKRAPILFKLWPKFRETGGQYAPPHLHLPTLDVNDKSSPALAQAVGGCLNDSYALDGFYVTSSILEDLFTNCGDLTKSSLAYLSSDACFVVEGKPFLLPDRSCGRPQPNCVDTGRELLAFCRWIVNTSVVLIASITIEEIKPSLAIEVAISTAVTGLAISTYYIQHGLENIDGFSSCIDRIWNQTLLWFEQLSMANLRVDSRYRNETRRALLHDRLISRLLESLLRLDSFIIAAHTYAPPRTRHLSSLWKALLSTTVFGNPFAPWRYRLSLFAYLVWPKTSMKVVCSTALSLPPPLVFLLSTHSSASNILRCYFLHWSLGYLLHPENPLPKIFPRISTIPIFGEKHVQLIEKFVYSHLPEPTDLWTRLFFHLVSPKMIEMSHLQEVVDYVLVDVEQRFGLVTVIFALLQRVPEIKWPHRLGQLIQSLLRPKSIDRLPQNVAAHCVDLDLNAGELSSSTCELTIGHENTTTIARPHSFESKMRLPLSAFSHPSLLSLTVKCLQDILSKSSWKSAYDTVWLAKFYRFLRNVNLFPNNNETVAGLLCSLIDTLKEAIKTQLVLKRWKLFLMTVSALNDFGEVLCVSLTEVGDEIFQNEIWEKIAGQVIRLAETAWVAGGTRWPKFEEGFLPPNLASVFCHSFAVWVREDTNTAFQPLRFLQRQSQEYGALLQIAGMDLAESNPSRSTYIQTAACLFAKDRFPAYIRTLQTSDQKAFKSLCCTEGFVAVASHLFRFVLLFTSDTSADLERNASRIGYHLVSRLALLFVELFATHQVDTGKLICSLSSSPSSSTNLSEALLEAGCHLLKDPREPDADSMCDPLGGYYPRISVWLAAARFISLLASSSPNTTPTSKSYLNWRLISGIIDLIDVEYERVVVKDTSIVSGDQLIEILDHLFQASGGSRFSNSICHLDNIFGNNVLLAPYQPHFNRHCKCNRRDVNEEVHRFLKWTDFLRHPRLLKYRAAGLHQLTALLRPRHEFTAAQLHERLVTALHDRTEEKMRLMEADGVQYWVPPAGNSGCGDVVNQKRLLFRILSDLSTGNHLVKIDLETRRAMAECVASLKDISIDEKSALEPLESVRELLFEKLLDPMIVEQLYCVISIANGITSPNSIFSRLGPQCLRDILGNPQLKMSLFGTVNISEVERRICILTKLAPYVFVEELKKVRNSTSQSALKFAIKNVTEAVLHKISFQTLVDLTLSYQSCPENTVLKIAEWLFDKVLVLDEFFLALKPLILVEVHVAKRLVPWIFVVVFVNLSNMHVPSLISITTNLEWDLNWLSASKLSLNAGKVETAWLFFELAWIKRPKELLCDSVAQNIWIDLCRAQKDLVGLKASQVAMAQFFDHSADGVALEDRFRYAINELDGWRSRLWEEGAEQGDQPSSANVARIALRLHHLGADKVFSQLAAAILSQDSENLPALMEAEYRVGWRSGVESNLDSIRRGCASCMGQWNETEVASPSNLEDEKLIYLLRQSVCCEDWDHVAKLVNDRRSSSIQLLSDNPTALQSFASEVNILQAWGHISTLLRNQLNASNARAASSVILLQASIEECTGWNAPQSTSLLEASLRLSKSLSDSVDDSSPWLPLLNVHTQLQLADLYIEHGNALCAERLLSTIPRIVASEELTLRTNISFALARSKLQRLCGETSLSCARLTGVLNDAAEVISSMKLNHGTPTRLLLESYLSSTVSLCKWLAECGAMSLADIVVRRLKPAIELTEKTWSPEVKQPLCSSADALAVLAEFADAQYQVLDGYLRSPEFAARRKLLFDADADAACLTEVDRKSRFLRLLQRQSTLESAELASLLSSLQSFFSTAILSYCQCLAKSDKFNLKVYRLVSLWLNALSQMEENRGLASCDLSEGSANESLFTPAWLASLEAHLRAIRVDKFLPLFSQLLVRLTTPNGEDRQSKTHAAFHAMLAKLVKALLNRHPYHTGFSLLALVNARLDDPPSAASSTTTSCTKRQRVEVMVVDDPLDRLTYLNPLVVLKFTLFVVKADKSGTRVVLARQLFSEVCSSDETRGKIFAQMQALTTAYIEWANVDVENKRNVKGDIPMPSSCALSRLSLEAERCLHLLPVITCPPRVDSSGAYHDLVRVVGFADTYRLAGGLNLPKIVTCLCSDGRRRKQLVKGRDDPRQDAIMQQVFSAANQLLAVFSLSNPSKCPKSSSLSASHANAMRIRTYMVVPLARRSGLIEWCEGTVPLGEWLAGETFGAHQRYRPSDLTPSQAKLKLAGARDKSLHRRLAIFEEICSKIQPVLGYFFLEHFPEPSAWYAARRRYTASLATASILGYLVGLGDRHPHNLLLCPTTGEVVHIDLGIAFDQGRLMPTPEMVPFRLTRDLVHALGPLGVEVGFVGTAELVLCAFSSGSDIILTLLEVEQLV